MAWPRRSRIRRLRSPVKDEYAPEEARARVAFDSEGNEVAMPKKGEREPRVITRLREAMIVGWDAARAKSA
ncbi:MAG: hypothetical protein HYS26_01390 [Candidatus Kaiserbacteria bacterium]|nr:MAG: hypothetical protein HYS26_01390 [Candidatus Kaiserbacteria bacterium]